MTKTTTSGARQPRKPFALWRFELILTRREVRGRRFFKTAQIFAATLHTPFPGDLSNIDSKTRREKVRFYF